jgi:predicted enzyme related to lactoylglutathione lyase
MPERTSYAPGTPSWVDLGSPDPAASAAFYGEMFGWNAAIDPRPEAGGYGMFTLQDKNVAGIGPQMNPDLPPFWAVYLTVADADETAAKVTANGGTVVVEPMDIFDAGRMGVAQDSVGSFISFWQPREHIGCQLVNEPGTFGWNELATPDVAGAKAFYTNVFGLGLDTEMGGEDAAVFTIDGNMVCGAHTAGPDEFPAWSVWFGVEDCDERAAKAVELGGTILMPPNDMDFGRGSVIADPQGAVFGIAAVKPEMLAE